MAKKSEPQNEKIVSPPEVSPLEKAKPQTTELTENKVKISQEKENNTKEEVKQPLDNEKLPPLQLDDAQDEFPKEYIVHKGDTLSGISKKFYKTVKHYKKIMQANNMVNANQLKIGKKIIIPKID
jgi:nucleoid-associated protein YgaU